MVTVATSFQCFHNKVNILAFPPALQQWIKIKNRYVHTFNDQRIENTWPFILLYNISKKFQQYKEDCVNLKTGPQWSIIHAIQLVYTPAVWGVSFPVPALLYCFICWWIIWAGSTWCISSRTAQLSSAVVHLTFN